MVIKLAFTTIRLCPHANCKISSDNISTIPTKLDCYICHPWSLEIHLFIQKPAATDILPILKDTTWVPHPENHLTCFALL